LQQQGNALAPMMLEKYKDPNDAMKKTLLEDRMVHHSRIDMAPNSWTVLHMRNIAGTFLLLDQDPPRSTEVILIFVSPKEERHEVVLRCHHRHHNRILRQVRDAAPPNAAAEARPGEQQPQSPHRLRRKKIHHSRSQDLWLLRTPNSGPSKNIVNAATVDLARFVKSTPANGRYDIIATTTPMNLYAPFLGKQHRGIQ
jgi:hypothetical protein